MATYSERILKLLADGERYQAQQISKLTKLNFGVTVRILGELQETGVVTRSQKWDKIWFRLSDETLKGTTSDDATIRHLTWQILQKTPYPISIQAIASQARLPAKQVAKILDSFRKEGFVSASNEGFFPNWRKG